MAGNLAWPTAAGIEWPAAPQVRWPGLGAPPQPPDAKTPPGAPRHLTAEPHGTTGARLTWLPPLDDGGSPVTRYDTQTEGADGAYRGGWEAAPHGALSATVRALAPGHSYRHRARAANSEGAGPPTPWAEARAAYRPPLAYRSERRLPLADEPRQSLIADLGGTRARITLWWQPSDGAWYATVEAPVNTYAVRSRRVTEHAGLLAGADSPLPGDIVCRPTSGAHGGAPGRAAWAAATHGLYWEPEQ